MKGLLIKDFKILKGQKQFFASVLVVTFVFLMTNTSFSFVISYITVMTGMLTLTTISYDDHENGMGYLFTLPISRKGYVQEKYLFGFMTTMPVLAAASAAAFLVSRVRHIDFTAEEWTEAVLGSLGIDNFDLCFVCIGTNFQSSLEITSLAKEMGARYVVSKANRDIHAKFLLRNGADEVIYPDRDIAEKIAVKYSANHVFDYIELTEEFSIYEIPPLPEWVGKSIIELSIRNKYRISILATKEGERAKLMPTADYVIRADEHLMVIGKNEDVDGILKLLK